MKRRHVLGTTTLLVAVLTGLGSAPGCGDSLDTEQAEAYCNRARQSSDTCWNDSVFQSCVACYEDCGVQCAQLDSCPLQFSCD